MYEWVVCRQETSFDNVESQVEAHKAESELHFITQQNMFFFDIAIKKMYKILQYKEN